MHVPGTARNAASTRPPATFAREVLSSLTSSAELAGTMSAAELGAAGSSAEPSVLGKKALGAEHLAASLSAERKKRQKSGALPSIPAISLTAMLDGDDDAAKAELGQQWDHACREVGFIKIVDHGVPRDVIDACWKATEQFFDEASLSEKLSVPQEDGYPYGYVGMAGETLVGSLDKDATKATAGDLKELFNICLGSDTPADDMPAPRWPKLADAAKLAKMKQAFTAYYKALASLTETLYRLCALALGLPQDYFAVKNTQHRNSLRCINYPSQKPPLVPQPGQVRASMHTDYGSLTILRLGGPYPGGLQVMGANGAWIDVTTTEEENCFVINLGDLMARWTNDRWLSTPHQVINPKDAAASVARRMSIAYFCNINMDVEVECIPTCKGQGGAKYEPIVAGAWLMRKHLQTTSGQLCYEKGQE